VVLAAGRRDRLDVQISVMAADCQFTPVVRRLSCLLLSVASIDDGGVTVGEDVLS